ncbi:MAG: transcription antitermination factor NusB [Paracoccaceae bacterium]|jgi:16S rRNA (cytosine967-C5)-methyltransferase
MPARIAAAQLLHGVLHDGTMISELIEDKDGPLADLSPSARARAQSLALSTLRHLAPLDIVLDQFLNKSPPLKVRNALRLAANELLVDGVAPHAAVDAAVRLVRESRKLQHLSGLANAVARRVAEHGPEIWADMDPQELPAWLRKPVERAYGEDALQGIEAAHAKGAPLDLSLRKASDAEKLAKELDAEILPTGSLRLQKPGQVSAMAGFDDGLWWVQDAAAAMPVQLLGSVKGLRVLDLCAAPGGKTMQLAAGGAEVTAVDISKDRLTRVTQNLQRTKLSAKIIASDIVRWAPEKPFDLILLDAPCSATGTIRRHPDLPFGKSGDLKPILRLQQKLLSRAFEWLKPGGKIVYCTCSLLPSEGEEQVEKFLRNHVDAKQLPANTNLPDLPADWIAKDGGLRLRPDFWAERGGMDGFYAALIEKAELTE